MSRKESETGSPKTGHGHDGGQHTQRQGEAARLVNEGASLLQRGDAKGSLPYLRKAWRLDPTEVAAAINLGGAYILLNRHKEAVPVLESAASLAPGNPMVWLNLGAAYLGNPVLATPAQQEKAIRAFERVLEIEPEMRNVNYNLGLIFRDRKDYVRAREEFQRALELSPNDRDARMLWEEMIANLERGSGQEETQNESSKT